MSSLVMPVAAWQDRQFSPYVDIGLYAEQPLANITPSVGVKYYTLAFVTSGGSGVPEWAGEYPMSDQRYLDEVNKVRALGGDVIISFGGASGTELADAVTNVTTLQADYQSVIDTYNATWIDFDIEGSAHSDSTGIDRRNVAIAALEAANPGLRVSYTLPVEPDGLTSSGLALIKDAQGNGVRIDVVNLMTMDYGSYYAPDPSGMMGTYAIECAESVKSQLASIYTAKTSAEIYSMIGLTPMIGQNDVSGEIFTLADAKTVTTYAQENDIGLLSMWSLARDNGSGAGETWASAISSGLTQSDYAFSSIFAAIDGSGSTTTTTTTTTVSTTPTATVTATPTTVATATVTTATPTVTFTVTPASGSTASSTIPAWNTSTIYVSGEVVTWNGETYEAQWWTQGETPGTAAVWKQISTGSTGTVAWVSAAVYTTGEEVTYHGSTYEAQWWTQRENPGIAAVWKLV